jgi:hypothetical protein
MDYTIFKNLQDCYCSTTRYIPFVFKYNHQVFLEDICSYPKKIFHNLLFHHYENANLFNLHSIKIDPSSTSFRRYISMNLFYLTRLHSIL